MDHDDIVDFSSPPGSPLSDFSPPKPLCLKLKPAPLYLNVNGDDELFVPKTRGSHHHRHDRPSARPRIQITYDDNYDDDDVVNDADEDEPPSSTLFPTNPFANMSLVSSPGMTAAFYGDRYLPDSKLLWSIAQHADLSTLRRIGLRCKRHRPEGFVRHRNPQFPRPFEAAVLNNNLVALAYLHEEVDRNLFNIHYDVPGDIVARAVRGAMDKGHDAVIKYLLSVAGLDPTGTLMPARALAASGLPESLEWRLTTTDSPFNPPPAPDMLRACAGCLESAVQADSARGPAALAVVTLLLDLGGRALRGSDLLLDSVVLALVVARWEEADVIFTTWSDHAGHVPPHDGARIVTAWRFANELRRAGQREAAWICGFLEDRVPHLIPTGPQLDQTFGYEDDDEEEEEDDDDDDEEDADSCRERQHWLCEDRSDVSDDEAATYQAYLDHARLGLERNEADAQLAAAVRAFDLEKLQQQKQQTVQLSSYEGSNGEEEYEEDGWVTISIGI